MPTALCLAVLAAQGVSANLRAGAGWRIFLLQGEFDLKLPSLERSEKSLLLCTLEKHGQAFLDASFVYSSQL